MIIAVVTASAVAVAPAQAPRHVEIGLVYGGAAHLRADDLRHDGGVVAVSGGVTDREGDRVGPHAGEAGLHHGADGEQLALLTPAVVRDVAVVGGAAAVERGRGHALGVGLQLQRIHVGHRCRRRDVHHRDHALTRGEVAGLIAGGEAHRRLAEGPLIGGVIAEGDVAEAGVHRRGGR